MPCLQLAAAQHGVEVQRIVSGDDVVGRAVDDHVRLIDRGQLEVRQGIQFVDGRQEQRDAVRAPCGQALRAAAGDVAEPVDGCANGLAGGGSDRIRGAQ